MVSVTVVGPSMSGKTHVCVMLSGLSCVSSALYNETLGVNMLKTDVNGIPWHIWDTPAYSCEGWAGRSAVDDSDVVVVCHDGSRNCNPCDIVKACDPNKCVIALTRSPYAGANLSYVKDYFCTTTSEGSLVPVVAAFTTPTELVHTISRMPRAATVVNV